MNESQDLLTGGLHKLDIDFNRQQIDAFITYLEELKKWNKAYNLTGLKTDRDIIIKHFLDSLLFAKVLPPEALVLADIGTGAGFPGIPVKIIFPHLSVFLIEPTQKKAIFLRHIINRLQLQHIEIIDKRVEEVNDLKVDVAVTRALYSIMEFVNKAKKMLTDQGILILSKGPGLDKELAELSAEALSGLARKDLVLPFEDIVRHLIVVRV